MAPFLCFSAVAETDPQSTDTREAAPIENFPARTPPPLELNDGDVVVFLGDSITHQCIYTQFIENYFYTRYPKRRIHFRNAGIGGEKVGDAAARFDADVAAFKPRVVAVLLGMNDASYRPFNDEDFKRYESGIDGLLDRIAGCGAVAITLGPTAFDARQSGIKPPEWVAATPERKAALKAYYNATLAYYGTWLADRSAELGVRHVGLAEPMMRLTTEVRAREPTFSMVADAVHPDANGHAVMAFSILDSLGVAAVVSAIQAAPDPISGEWKAVARGGEISEVEGTPEGFRFSFLAEALPWVVPEQARLGYSLTKSGQKLSNESIGVSGLDAGSYDLLIDGNLVGSYTRESLAAKVELQENENTPQYQRALAVALANLKRNENGVKPMRDLWAKHRHGGMDSGAFEKAIADIDRVIAIYDEKIFAIRQPQKHVYEIRRSSGAR